MERVVTIECDRVKLAATLHYPTCGKEKLKNKNWPLILVCHGFTGSRIGANRLFVKTARDLASRGYLVVRFDYGGCGESSGTYGEGGLDVLIEQTRYVLDYALGIDCVDKSHVYLLGHSLGGAVALLTAEKDTRVTSLVLWSPVAHPFSDIVRVVGQETYGGIHERGSIDYLGYMLSERFFTSLTKHHPLTPGHRFLRDVLIVHGSGDEVIPVDYCYLYERVLRHRVTGTCEKHVINGADHTFSTFDGTEELLAVTGSWMERMEGKSANWSDWII
jgi:uncharacterized protein